MSKSLSNNSHSAFFPGKVILTGEHSVVFGNLALLASLNLGVRCTASVGELLAEQSADVYLQHLLQLAGRVLKKENLTVALQIKSSLSVKSGLGSSAALAAAVLQAVTNFFGQELTKEELYQLVLEAENFIHGRSSGADPAIVIHGGLVAFAGGKIIPFSSQALAAQTFFLINSGAASESTGEMVTLVKHQPNQQKIIEQIAELSQKMYVGLQKELWQPQLLDQNQLLLEELGVVGTSAKQIVAKLQKAGAHCKITGAGGVSLGSGYILATHQDPQFFAAKLKTMNLDFFETKLGLSGEKQSATS